MEGFTGARPVQVKVSFADDPVPLSAAIESPNGLRAETKDDQGIITRWFVPWSSVTYINQVLTAEESGVGVVVTDPDNPPPAGPGGEDPDD